MKKKPWLQNIRFYRWFTQGFILMFLLFVILKPVFFSEGVFASAEAYCPLGGLASLLPFLTEGNTLPHTHYSNLILLGILVLITLLLRSGFCSWICPFGTVQDLVRKFGGSLGKLAIIKSLKRKQRSFLKKYPQVGINLDKYFRYIKYLLLIWILFGAVYFSELVFRDVDPYVAFIKVTELESMVGLIILLFFGVLSLFIERPWCKYACPLGAFVGLVGKLSPMRIKRNSSTCIQCNRCTQSCPMNIDVASQSNVTSLDCNHCMTCIDSCPVQGTLTVGAISVKSERGAVYEK